MARVVIASGGTGGHFYPGYCLALELRKRGHEVLVLVRKDDPALPRLEAADLPALPVDVTGMPRRPSPAAVAFAWRMTMAVGLLARAFRSYRPKAFVGMGAYVSFPGVLAAWSRRVPVVLHESNTRLGLANSVSLPFAKQVCFGLPPESGLPEKGLLTGTPVREALWKRADARAARRELGLEPDAPTLLVFGGSQGATRVNALVPKAAAQAGVAGLQVLHLTGKGGGPAAEAAHRAAGTKHAVREYLERMELAFAAADLAVCRSGASTCSELLHQGVPSLLVPYPFAAGDHQAANARALERAGCARVLPEAGLDEAGLAGAVRALFGDPARLEAMRRACGSLAVPRGQAAVDALAGAIEAVID